ncbi:unnamed protein product [Pleuronectes platessa]|uniref:Uncharacterized protein n=1 Tax=Pleuronectes platessa TaxID=8262 RepID=A0A9N7TRD5_PLEPL|nr:unnamed protein product [Pleuronectes platessa]
MQASPAASTVHAQQPSRPRSTIQTRRHSSPQYRPPPPTGPIRKPTTAVLVHRPCPMPTRHQGRHQHHDQPNPPQWIHHATPGVRSQTPSMCGHRGLICG